MILTNFCFLILIANPTKLINRPIVGGENVSITSFPWQVSLVGVEGHFCGGSIIGRKVILTAAHCIRNEGNPDYEQFIKVRIGTSQRQRGGFLRSIKKIIVHEFFNMPTLYNNDIALVILKYPLMFTRSVQQIDLIFFNEQLEDNTNVTVSGWGSRELPDDPDLPDQLQAVTVPIVNWDTCVERYEEEMPPQFAITENMVCAGFLEEGGRDSCQVSKNNSSLCFHAELFIFIVLHRVILVDR